MLPVLQSYVQERARLQPRNEMSVIEKVVASETMEGID